MKSNLLISRSNLYKDLKNNPHLLRDDNIMYKFKITDSEIKNLKKKVKDLIINNLRIYFRNIGKEKKNYLNQYSDLIVKLPNITPGGAIQPRKEVAKYFNKIHVEIVKILKKKKIFDYFESGTKCVVRFKSGANKNNKREYSTFKVHSDAWNGQIANSIFMIGVEGDITNNTVLYFKPLNFKKDILKKIKSFDEGKRLYKNKRYIGKLEKNQMVIIDQLCLHKTHIKSKMSRVSIDFAFNLKNTIKKDKFFKKESRRYVHYKKNNWEKLNFLKIRESKISLFDQKL
jgi:hypothetical protein